MKFGTIIVGGGRGKRMGTGIPKCLIRINDIPLILLTAWNFCKIREIEAIIIVVPSGSENIIKNDLKNFNFMGISGVVPGGERRQDSVFEGIKALPADIDKVLIHDGARVFTSEGLILSVVQALSYSSAVLPGLPVTDTIHTVKTDGADQRSIGGIDRSGILLAQTPQGFDRKLLTDALDFAQRSNRNYTDEATLVRDTSQDTVKIVNGEPTNVKITFQEDLTFYQPQLSDIADDVKGEGA